MKPASRRILYRIALPGIVLTLFACGQEQKPAEGKWTSYPPSAAHFASYSGGPQRQASVKVQVNGEQWAANLHYRGAELDSVEVTEGAGNALAGVLSKNPGAFEMPSTLADSSADLSAQWVSSSFEDGGRFITDDINFDGHPDLLVFDAAKSGATNQFYDIWIYQPEKRSYYQWELPNRQGLGLWDIDREQRTITLGYHGSEDEQEVAVYRVVKDTFVKLVKRMDSRKR